MVGETRAITPGQPGAGQITLNPATGTKLYPKQRRYLTAIIDNGTNHIPTDGSARVSFTSTPTSGFNVIDGQDPGNVPVVIDKTDPTKGTASVLVDFAGKTGSLQLTAGPSTVWQTNPPTASPTSTCAIQTSDPTIQVEGPSRIMLAAAPTGTDNLTPNTGDTAFWLSFQITVTDGGPVPDYVVEWHEAVENKIELFTARMNSYLSNAPNVTYADRLQVGDPQIIPEKVGGGHFVRTVTNSNGVATLYLVARSSSVSASVYADYDITFGQQGEQNFIVVDLHNTFYTELMPTVDGIESDGKLHYADIQGPDVGVLIPDYSDNPSDKPDTVYLVVNGNVVYHQRREDMSFNEGWNASFPTASGYSDIPPNANKQNEVLFVVGTQGGDVYPSKINTFLGTGNNQKSVIPTSGPLDNPTIVGTGTYISWNFVQNPVFIQLDLNQPDVPWQAQDGDTIVGHALLTGYEPNSDRLKQPLPLVSTNTYKYVVGSGDTTAQLQFDNTKFWYWDTQKDYPYTVGMAYFYYVVTPKADPNNPLKSEVFQAVLNTADQSFKAKLKAKSA